MDKNELVFKYLNNNLSLQEWEELENWLKENQTNRTTLNKLESYYKIHDDLDIPRETIWDELKDRISHEENVSVRSSRPSYTYKYLKAAAVFLLVATFSFVAYEFTAEDSIHEQPPLMIHKVTVPGQKITTSLPDGSIVTLNAGSRIQFPEKFEENKREVELTGEAFFEVEHDPDKPFYVKSNGSFIKVLGTSFNVRTYQDENRISVAVASGRVSFSASEHDSEVILEPDEMVSYDSFQNELTRNKVDPLEIFGWKDKILFFKNEGFEEIVKELERWYGVRITVQGDFTKKGNFSGEFRNKSLENVLIGLSYLYEFDYQINKNNVVLK